MLILRIHKLKHIEADMVVLVRGIKINHVFHAMRRNCGKHRFHIFSVRVNQADSVAVLDVLDNHVEHQHGLTGAGFTQKINMLAPVFALYAEKYIFVAISTNTQISKVLIERYFWNFHIAKLYHPLVNFGNELLLLLLSFSSITTSAWQIYIHINAAVIIILYLAATNGKPPYAESNNNYKHNHDQNSVRA